MNYYFHPLDPNFEIHVNPSLDLILSDDLNQLIDACWESECKKRGQLLFNGTLFSATSHSSKSMQGHFIPYKIYVAWTRLAEVRPRLDVHPVGLTGITRSGSSLLLGRRTLQMAHYPGLYECAPAGGVDATFVKDSKIEYAELLLHELEEETPLSRADVIKLTPKAICERRGEDYSGFELLLDVALDKKCVSQSLSSTKEYQQLLWLDPEQLTKFFLEKADELVPTTRRIIERLSADPPSLPEVC